MVQFKAPKPLKSDVPMPKVGDVHEMEIPVFGGCLRLKWKIVSIEERETEWVMDAEQIMENAASAG